MRNTSKLLLSLTLALASQAHADAFKLTSTDIAHGKPMNTQQEFQGFGCNGGNTSPQLSWSGAPKGTEAFALFAYDPDAPTGSGWWHWQLINIPKNVNALPAGAGDATKKLMPEGSFSTRNDYGVHGFGGACPPKGHGVHRYQFTLFALPKALDIPKDASPALAGYLVKANAIGSTTLEALYKRD